MTDRQTIIDLFEKHADWHNDLAWIEVGRAADLVVDLEDAPTVFYSPEPDVMDAIRAIVYNRPTEDELSGEDG